MSHAYRFVGWNRQKAIYDRTLGGFVALYLLVFVVAGSLLEPEATIETLLIRALGTGAFFLLHVILAIGPLCRLDRRFLPLLYNRRHLGVTMFGLALAHGVFSIVQFHALGDVAPLVSVLTSNGRWGDLAQFPFQPLGLVALVILFLMAATSHDFWLANLSPPTWKALHMGVYVAYGLIVLHVAFGALQAERHPLAAALVAAGAAVVLGLHLAAGWRERAADRELGAGAAAEGYVEVCRVGEIPEARARVACLSGERVAVFRHQGRLSAVSGVCQHQNGPLGEGRILDGCITCPWHGFQYRPEDGASPPPFTERVPTFRVRLEGDRVLVDPRPLPAGTYVEPAVMAPEGAAPSDRGDFYVGYRRRAPQAVARFVARAAAGLAVLGLLLALGLVLLQGPFDPGVFEYGVVEEVRGVVALQPYPRLILDRPEIRAGRPLTSALLVAAGKHGAEPQLAGLDGQPVALRGSWIYREGEAMIEIVAGSVAPTGGGAAAAAATVDLGVQTLRGEIVDAKCFLGVMKPGRGKTHRACAARCISGGIQPMLRVEAEDGGFLDLLLTDEAGRPVNDRVLDVVAEPIEITGRVRREGDDLVLAADPSTYRRL